MNTCKCGTALIPFEGHVLKTCSKCTAGKKDRQDEFGAVTERVRKMALMTDKVCAEKTHRNPHHIYWVRRRMGLKKYRTDHYVRPARKAA